MKEHEDPQHIVHGAERKSGFIIIHSRLRVTVIIEAIQLFKREGKCQLLIILPNSYNYC